MWALGRICEEEIGPDVNVSILGRVLEDTSVTVGNWNDKQCDMHMIKA